MVWLLSAALIAGVTQRWGAGLFVGGALLVAARAARVNRVQAFALSALALACLVHGAAVTRAFERERTAFVRAFNGGRAVVVSGRVEGFPRSSPYGTSFRLAATCDDGTRLHLLVRAVCFDISPGDSIEIAARGTSTRRRPRSLFADGVVGVVRVRAGDVVVRSRARPSLVWRVHRYARETLSRRLGSRAALPLALLLGERGFVDRGTREAFARLGVAHLLALSGMHLGLVMLIAWGVLRLTRTPPRRAEWIVAGVMLAYVGVVGDLHSLRRAFAMAVVLFGSRLVQRPADVMGALGRALFILLAARPAAFYSAGFQLSFVATFAVVLVVAGWRSRRMRARRILAAAGRTLVAGASVLVVTVPLQLHYFGALSPWSPVATLALLPLVAALLALSAVAVGLARVPIVGAAACAALEGGAGAVQRCVAVAAAHVPEPLAVPPPHAGLYACGVVLVVLGRRRRALGMAGAVVLATAFTKSCGM